MIGLLLLICPVFSKLHAQETFTAQNTGKFQQAELTSEQTTEFRKMADGLSYKISKDSSDTKLFSERAKIYLILKEHHKAVADYDHLIGIDSKNVAHFYFRGLNKLAMNDRFGACADLRRANELNYDYISPELLMFCH